MNDSNDWLASIDLDAVKPTGPRQTTKSKKPRRRIVYGEPARLAPTIPSWAVARGPDQQRAVTEVAGKFIPTDELCPAQFIYQEVLALMTFIESAGMDSRQPAISARLLAVLHAAITPYEFKRAAESHRASEAAQLQELTKLIHNTIKLIPLEDE